MSVPLSSSKDRFRWLVDMAGKRHVVDLSWPGFNNWLSIDGRLVMKWRWPGNNWRTSKRFELYGVRCRIVRQRTGLISFRFELQVDAEGVMVQEVDPSVDLASIREGAPVPALPMQDPGGPSKRTIIMVGIGCLAVLLVVVAWSLLFTLLVPKLGFTTDGSPEPIEDPKPMVDIEPGSEDNDAVPHSFKIEGSLSRDAIVERFEFYSDDILACYESALDTNPDLEGKVVVEFVLTKYGSVTKAEISYTTLNSTVVEECLLEKIPKWHFPQPEDREIVEVRYPIVFKVQ